MFLDFAFGTNISQSQRPLQELNGSLNSKFQLQPENNSPRSVNNYRIPERVNSMNVKFPFQLQ